MDSRLDGYHRCSTCGYVCRTPRSLLVKRGTEAWFHPVVGHMGDEALFVQFNNSVMIMDYEQAAEIADKLSELLAEEDYDYETEAPVNDA